MDLFYGLVLLLSGYLSPVNNGVFDKVVDYRKYKPVEYSLPKELDTTEYECLIGLPYGYKHLIGKQSYFYDYTSNTLRGPWLIVDVESNIHQGQMLSRRLVADINCKEYKSHYGVLMLYENN